MRPVNQNIDLAIQSAGVIRQELAELGFRKRIDTSNENSKDSRFGSKEDNVTVNNFTTEIAAAYDVDFQNAFSTLYQRGVNVSRPEILCTTEFIPIINNDLMGVENNYEINLSVGDERTIQVKQVFRLLELHRNIKHANTKLINDIIDQILIRQGYELSLKTLYGELEARFDISMLSPTFGSSDNTFSSADEAVDHFIEYMSDYHSDDTLTLDPNPLEGNEGNILDFSLLSDESIKQKPSYRLVYHMFIYRIIIEGIIDYVLSISALKKAFKNHIDLRIDGGKFSSESTAGSARFGTLSVDGSKKSDTNTNNERNSGNLKSDIKNLHKLIAGSTQYGYYSVDNRTYGSSESESTPQDLIDNIGSVQGLGSNSERSASNLSKGLSMQDQPPPDPPNFPWGHPGNNLNIPEVLGSRFPYFQPAGFVTSNLRTKIACHANKISDEVLNTQLIVQILGNLFTTCKLSEGIPGTATDVMKNTIESDTVRGSHSHFAELMQDLKNVDFDCLYGGRANPYVGSSGLNSDVAGSVFLRGQALNNRSAKLTDESFVAQYFPDAIRRNKESIMDSNNLNSLFLGSKVGESNVFGSDQLPSSLSGLLDASNEINLKTLNSLSSVYVASLFDLCASINMFNLSITNSFKSINFNQGVHQTIDFDEFGRRIVGLLSIGANISNFGDKLPETDFGLMLNKFYKEESVSNQILKYLPSETITNDKMIEDNILSSPSAFPFLAKDVLGDPTAMASMKEYANQMSSFVDKLALDINAIFGLDQGAEYGYVPPEGDENYCTINTTSASPVHIIEKTFELIKDDLEDLLANDALLHPASNKNWLPVAMSVISAVDENISRNYTQSIVMAEYSREEILRGGNIQNSEYYDDINDLNDSSHSGRENWSDITWAGLFAIPMTSDMFYYLFENIPGLNQNWVTDQFDNYKDTYYKLFGDVIQGPMHLETTISSTAGEAIELLFEYSDALGNPVDWSGAYEGSRSFSESMSFIDPAGNGEGYSGVGISRSYTYDSLGYLGSDTAKLHYNNKPLGTSNISDNKLYYGPRLRPSYIGGGSDPSEAEKDDYFYSTLDTSSVYKMQSVLAAQFTDWVGKTNIHLGIKTPANKATVAERFILNNYSLYKNHITKDFKKPIVRHEAESPQFEDVLEDPYVLPEPPGVENAYVKQVWEQAQSAFGATYQASGLYQLVGEDRYNATYGPLKLNRIARSLVSTQLFNVFLGTCIELKVAVESEKVTFRFGRKNIEGVIKALDGQAQPELEDDGANVEVILGYRLAKSSMMTIRNYYLKHRQNIFDKFVPLIAHFNAVKRIANYVTNFFDLDKSLGKTHQTTFAFKALNSLVNETADSSAMENILSPMINLASNQYVASSFKSYVNFFAPSEEFTFFTNSDAVSEIQMKLMSIALGTPGFGLTEDEKSGKKTVFHVGIPSTFIESAAQSAWKKTRDQRYLDSSKVCIYVFKYHDIPNSVLYYPKAFIFDANKFTIENSRLRTPRQIEAFNENWGFDNLRNHFSLYTINSGNIVEQQGIALGLDDFQWLASSSRANVKKEEVNNHILDHYLKMYYKLANNIILDEFVFKLKKSHLYSPANVDPGLARNVYTNEFINDMLARFPAGNVNPNLKLHFNRLFRTAKMSSFLSGKSKIITSCTPNVFDRVFSILINESDFVAYPVNPFDTLDEFYKSCPTFSLDSSLQITTDPNINIEATISAMQLGNSYKNHFAEISGEASITEANYFCVATVLRK